MIVNRTRSYMPWLSLGEQIDRLNGEFNRLFGRGGRLVENAFPAFNIYSNAEGAILTAELPGVNIEDIELTVSGNVVSIKGSRKDPVGENGKRLRRERKSGEFSRTFELPYQIEASKVEAKSSKGVLKIELPRAEVDKPRRIEVKSV